MRRRRVKAVLTIEVSYLAVPDHDDEEGMIAVDLLNAAQMCLDKVPVVSGGRHPRCWVEAGAVHVGTTEVASFWHRLGTSHAARYRDGES